MGSERLIESFTQTINVIILITLIHVEMLLWLGKVKELCLKFKTNNSNLLVIDS